MLAVDSHASGACVAGANGLSAGGAEPNSQSMFVLLAEPVLERSSIQSTRANVLRVTAGFSGLRLKRELLRRLEDLDLARSLSLKPPLRLRHADGGAAKPAATTAAPRAAVPWTGARAPEWFLWRVRDLDRLLDRDLVLDLARWCCTRPAVAATPRCHMPISRWICEFVRGASDADSQSLSLTSMGAFKASALPPVRFWMASWSYIGDSASSDPRSPGPSGASSGWPPGAPSGKLSGAASGPAPLSPSGPPSAPPVPEPSPCWPAAPAPPSGP